jgi:uncharacterized Zn finger protein
MHFNIERTECSVHVRLFSKVQSPMSRHKGRLQFVLGHILPVDIYAVRNETTKMESRKEKAVVNQRNKKKQREREKKIQNDNNKNTFEEIVRLYFGETIALLHVYR